MRIIERQVQGEEYFFAWPIAAFEPVEAKIGSCSAALGRLLSRQNTMEDVRTPIIEALYWGQEKADKAGAFSREKCRKIINTVIEEDGPLSLLSLAITVLTLSLAPRETQQKDPMGQTFKPSERMDIDGLLKAGAMMGLGPEEVMKSSLGDLLTAWDGWVNAQPSDEKTMAARRAKIDIAEAKDNAARKDEQAIKDAENATLKPDERATSAAPVATKRGKPIAEDKAPG